jgi:membrane-bound lytic murein transglycosylase B
MKHRLLVVSTTFLLCVSCARAVESVDPVYVDVDSAMVIAFIDEMVSVHEFDRAALRRTLGQAEIKPSIIKKISTPAERTLSWAEYRKIFITKERINAGVTFWKENQPMLERIETETGVAIPMIVGIIGVETYFGRITGKDRVLDALATLAFDYPKRAAFFRNELVQFLILTREEDIDATVPVGSYAGAMGRPQFMPSSFRAYAVDATGDGKRDIWNDWADVRQRRQLFPGARLAQRRRSGITSHAGHAMGRARARTRKYTESFEHGAITEPQRRCIHDRPLRRQQRRTTDL